MRAAWADNAFEISILFAALTSCFAVSSTRYGAMGAYDHMKAGGIYSVFSCSISIAAICLPCRLFCYDYADGDSLGIVWIGFDIGHRKVYAEAVLELNEKSRSTRNVRKFLFILFYFGNARHAA